MRGIVLEIKDGRCVVLKKDGTFEEVRNRNYTVGQEVSLAKPPYVKYLTAAACLLLICTAAFGHHLYFTPTSYVYLDINPSIRLDLNRFERIIDVVPLNDDAENLLSSATISRKNAQECMNDIETACQEQNNLNERNTDIEVSVRTDDIKLESAVETASAAIGETELAVSVFQMDEEENNSAMGYHISARRLRAVRAYTEQFGGTLDENLEVLKGVTSDEIYEIIREYRRAVQAAEKPEAQPKTENSAPSETPLSPDAPQPKPQNPSDRREEPQAQRPDSPSSNSQPAPGHQLTTKRLDAIRAYTEQFGGTLEENAALLQGISSLEIYRMIEEAQAETPEQTVESDTP